MRKADLLKPGSLKDITKDVDVVVHLAGLMRFHDPWDLLYNHNVKATQTIAGDALQHGVQHFIYSSSTEAIGLVTSIPAMKQARITPPMSMEKPNNMWLKLHFLRKINFLF